MRSLLHPELNYKQKINNETNHFDYSYNVSKQEDFNNVDKNFSSEDLNKWKRCGVIVLKQFNNSKYFLVVKGASSGIWSLPKGRIMIDEEEEDCASRELWEETGLLISPNRLKSLGRLRIDYNVYFVLDLDTMENRDIAKVLKNIKEFATQDHNEVSEVAWKCISDLMKMTCNKDIRNLIRRSQKHNEVCVN